MAFRSKMSRRASRSNFSRHAAKTHIRNLAPMVMRGGIRL